MNKPICKVLIGMPCSGKSTWAEKQGIPIISCDRIRQEFNTNYNPKIENQVWEIFYGRLASFKEDFIIDNTNCKQSYINKIKSVLKDKFEIEYIWFDVPLWKAKYRNIIRYLKTGKWIPIKVLENMYKNYKNLKND